MVPSKHLRETALAFIQDRSARLILEYYVSYTVLAPFAIGHFVAGGVRGRIRCRSRELRGFCAHDGTLTEPVGRLRATVLERCPRACLQQSYGNAAARFVGTARLPISALQYTGISEKTQCARQAGHSSRGYARADRSLGNSRYLAPLSFSTRSLTALRVCPREASSALRETWRTIGSTMNRNAAGMSRLNSIASIS